MRLLKDLIYEQYKNFKILFRNLSSVLLLIIGPLALILLIGFAYSGNEIHDVNIGVISTDYSVLEPAFANFSAFAEIHQYKKTQDCIKDISLQKIHICLEFSENFIKKDGSALSELPSGTITFYFDNSRKTLSNKIVETLSEYFGIEAEKISIESAKTIFSNIQTLVIYLERKNDDIVILINESHNIKQDLIERHERLIKIREDFLPVYEQSKQIQARIDNLSIKTDESYADYNKESQALLSELNHLKRQLRKLDFEKDFFFFSENKVFKLTDDLDFLENYTYYNLSQYNYSIINDSLIVYLDESINNATEILFDVSEFEDEDIASFLIKAALLAIESAEASINSFSKSAEEYYNYTYQQKIEFDNAVLLLDSVKDMLDMDIAATEEYIVKIDAAVEKVELIRKELTSSLVQLSKLEPEMAEKLIKPILKNFEPVLPGVENIRLAFPGMLAIIIIFISILFSNIVTLAEITSKAFYRNLIAPVNSIIFIIGLIITNILVVFFQIVVLLLVGQFKFNIDIFSVFLPLSIIIILLSLFFICLGMITSVLLRNAQTSILTTTFFALGFFLFSDAVAPLETMPPLASLIAAKNPFVIASLAFKKIIIFGLPLTYLSYETTLLAAYLFTALIILIFISLMKLK